METRFRSWWQQIKKHLVSFLVVAIILLVLIALIIVEIRLFGTGFAGKALWDWLQLLIIPAVLAVAGYIINLTISRGEQAATEQRAKSEREAAEERADSERKIAEDNQREVALQEYLDRMSELLLEKDLRKSTPDDEVRSVARVRTLTVLCQLDNRRINYVLSFLRETKLVTFESETSIISFCSADLSSVDFKDVNLSDIDLSKANLSKADTHWS